MPKNAIYVSSKLRHRDLWLSSGLPIVSSWIHGKELPPEECSAMWDQYCDEVALCDTFILYAEAGDDLKGCMIEIGIAFSLRRPIVIVWTGGLDALMAKIGTIVHHCYVKVVGSIDEARDILT